MTTAAWVVPSAAVRRRRRTAALQIAPFIASDAFAVFVAAAAVVLARYWMGGQFELALYFRMSVVVAFFLLAYAVLGLYRTVALHPVTEIQGIFRGTTLTVLLLGTLTFFQRDAEVYSRAILIASWVVIIAAVWGARAGVRGVLARTDWWGERAVILGAGRAGRSVADTLERKREHGLRVMAILDDDPSKLELARGKAPIAAPLNAAAVLAEELGVRYAIVAMPNARGPELTEILERHASRFHHVFIIPNLFGVSSLGVDARDLGGVVGVKVSHRLLHRTPQLFKRAFDLGLACAGGVVLAPLIAGVWLAVRLTSSGPGFYGHPRIGRAGAPFVAWKFRTMVADGEEVLRRYLGAHPEQRGEWERDRKLKDDPRTTCVGRVLRRTSMDELPQLWNVIRGEMSLVGPRPIVPEEVDKYGARYGLYRKVRPGLTGMWQVSGRNNTTYEERVQFDEYYVRNWSVWLDVYILSRTIKVVLTGEGAY
jgi:Undecaprenyl-phosphate galactose phosphotransferase WbaP